MKDIQSGKVARVYLLHGEEPFFIDKVSAALTQLVPEGSRDFNLSILYGDEVTPRDVLDHCKQYPMMSDRRVVLVREAQTLKKMMELEKYVESPVPSTVLVLAHKHKKIDGRSAFAKKLKKLAVVLESKRLYDNQVGPWIADFLTMENIDFEPSVPSILAQHLGQDLSKIEGEIEKVRNNLKSGQKLTPEMIEKWVGISREYNVFELQRAMSMGNVEKVMTIVQYFADNVQTHHPLLVISSLYNYFQKVMTMGVHRKANDKVLLQKLRLSSPFFLKEYKQALRFWNGRKVVNAFLLLSEYDLKLKGVDNRRTPPGALLKEMVFRMLMGE